MINIIKYNAGLIIFATIFLLANTISQFIPNTIDSFGYGIILGIISVVALLLQIIIWTITMIKKLKSLKQKTLK